MSRSRHPGPRSRLGALRRLCGFDGNPLRRDVDRHQRLLGLALVAFFLVAALVGSLRAGASSYDHGVRVEHAEAATWSPVSAVVTGVTERRRGFRLEVTGTASDGHHIVGSYTTARATAVGDAVQLWATPTRLTADPPRSHARTVSDTVVAVGALCIVVAAPLALVYLLFRRRCERVRSRLWDTAWTSFDRHPTR
ncbi:hypothetical protein AB0L06_42720 [Spirillospora sp. NPDC052269]